MVAGGGIDVYFRQAQQVGVCSDVEMNLGDSEVTDRSCSGIVTAEQYGKSSPVGIGAVDSTQYLASPLFELEDKWLQTSLALLMIHGADLPYLLWKRHEKLKKAGTVEKKSPLLVPLYIFNSYSLPLYVIIKRNSCAPDRREFGRSCVSVRHLKKHFFYERGQKMFDGFFICDK